MSPSGLRPTRLEAYMVISIFSFDPNLEPSPMNPTEGRPSGHRSCSLEWLRHLSGGGLRSYGMPLEGYADPVMNDELGFHSDIPIIKLTERVTRAIEASDVSSMPLVAETTDRVMHETRPTP